jgi:hypothetical protein
LAIKGSVNPNYGLLAVMKPEKIGRNIVQIDKSKYFTEVRGAASNSAYYELWMLRYPAHRYHAVPSPGFEPLWLRVRRPNYSATTLHVHSQLSNFEGVKIN